VNCPRCGSDRRFAFEANREGSRGTVAAGLPVVCRACGQITVNDQPVSFPVEFEQQAKGLAEAADAAGQEALHALQVDPNIAIPAYFARVYRKAYLDGFFRAMGYALHHAKEGRLRRLRELWEAVGVSPGRNPMLPDGQRERMLVDMSQPAYDEFVALLRFGVTPAEQDVARPTNESPAVPDRDS